MKLALGLNDITKEAYCIYPICITRLGLEIPIFTSWLSAWQSGIHIPIVLRRMRTHCVSCRLTPRPSTRAASASPCSLWASWRAAAGARAAFCRARASRERARAAFGRAFRFSTAGGFMQGFTFMAFCLRFMKVS